CWRPRPAPSVHSRTGAGRRASPPDLLEIRLREAGREAVVRLAALAGQWRLVLSRADLRDRFLDRGLAQVLRVPFQGGEQAFLVRREVAGAQVTAGLAGVGTGLHAGVGERALGVGAVPAGHAHRDLLIGGSSAPAG